MQRQERWNSVLACNLLCATDDSFKDIDDLAEHKDEKTVFSFHSNFYIFSIPFLVDVGGCSWVGHSLLEVRRAVPDPMCVGNSFVACYNS